MLHLWASCLPDWMQPQNVHLCRCALDCRYFLKVAQTARGGAADLHEECECLQRPSSQPQALYSRSLRIRPKSGLMSRLQRHPRQESSNRSARSHPWLDKTMQIYAGSAALNSYPRIEGCTASLDQRCHIPVCCTLRATRGISCQAAFLSRGHLCNVSSPLYRLDGQLIERGELSIRLHDGNRHVPGRVLPHEAGGICAQLPHKMKVHLAGMN